jgi:hypothetical protein
VSQTDMAKVRRVMVIEHWTSLHLKDPGYRIPDKYRCLDRFLAERSMMRMTLPALKRSRHYSTFHLRRKSLQVWLSHHILTVEFPAWLVKNVMIQGYMLLTERHICFFAQLPRTNVPAPGNLVNFRTRSSRRDIYTRNLATLPADTDTGLY